MFFASKIMIAPGFTLDVSNKHASVFDMLQDRYVIRYYFGYNDQAVVVFEFFEFQQEKNDSGLVCVICRAAAMFGCVVKFFYVGRVGQGSGEGGCLRSATDSRLERSARRQNTQSV